MTAFGHTIHTDYTPIKATKTPKHSPSLNLKTYYKPFKPYSHIIKYQQNQGREVFLSTTHSFNENVQTQMWCFTVCDVVSFIWEQGCTTIYYLKVNDTENKLLEYWFLHTLLPIFFTIEGKYEFIHAGGVEINSRPVLFIAPSYGGKSTLTDFFIQKGHYMVSDDRVALFENDNKIMCVSSYDYHRPYRKMEDLGLKVDKFMKAIKPLHKIYVLQGTDPNSPVSFENLKGIEKFKALQYNFDFTLPLNKASSFELIAKIASSVSIYRVSIPWDLAHLEQVYRSICEHSNNKENA